MPRIHGLSDNLEEGLSQGEFVIELTISSYKQPRFKKVGAGGAPSN